MLFENSQGLLAHNEAKLLCCNLLGILLIRFEQVVIQVFRYMDGGSDVVTIRREDDCFELGKLSLCAQILEAFGQFVQLVDIITIHVLQKGGHRAVLHMEGHF